MFRKNITLITAIGLLVAFKFAYTQASVGQLKFILYPVDLIVSLSSNSTSTYIAGNGYFYPELNILIEKSCSGFNFLAINFIIFYVTFNLHFKEEKKKWLYMPICFLGSYVLTIVVNSSRILTAIALSKIDLFKSDLAHEVQGTFVYLFFILITYLLLNKSLHTRKNENLAST